MTLNFRGGDKNVQDVLVSGVGVGRGEQLHKVHAQQGTKAVWIICVPTHKKKKKIPWLFKTLKCAVLEDTGRRVAGKGYQVVPLC